MLNGTMPDSVDLPETNVQYRLNLPETNEFSST